MQTLQKASNWKWICETWVKNASDSLAVEIVGRVKCYKGTEVFAQQHSAQHLPLPPLRCKRPWYFFGGFPQHISMANLACYAVPASPSPHHSSWWLTEQGHQATLDEKKNAFIYLKEKRNGLMLIGLYVCGHCIQQWPCGSHMREKNNCCFLWHSFHFALLNILPGRTDHCQIDQKTHLVSHHLRNECDMVFSPAFSVQI